MIGCDDRPDRAAGEGEAGPGGQGLRCRLCASLLAESSLIRLDRAPRGAQAFLDSSQIASDVPVRLDIRQCPDCGIVQACAPAVPDWQYVIRAAAYSQAMGEIRRRQARHFLEYCAPVGTRVLEVGCATGDFLEILRECGATAFGVEASPAAVETARARGFNVELGYPSSGHRLGNSPFDGFVTLNVLEHAVDPRDFLRGVKENLRPGAVGMVEVPSFERMLEQARYYDFIADHLSYFTADTLSLALRMTGFEVLEVSRDWWVDDIVALVRVRPPLDVGSGDEDLQGAVTEVRAFLDRGNRAGPSAVWGASHQALTLLALAQPKHVAYVVDSAPFKQGRFTPATHLPVVAPAHLAKEPPAAVLVMAAGYSDEVVHLLREAHHFSGEIGVLRANHVEVIDRSAMEAS